MCFWGLSKFHSYVGEPLGFVNVVGVRKDEEVIVGGVLGVHDHYFQKGGKINYHTRIWIYPTTYEVTEEVNHCTI